MRQLWFIVALAGAFGFAHAAETPPLKTNSMAIGMAGKLEILTPPDWTLIETNLNFPDHPITYELHSPQDAIAIRFYVRWDGFGGSAIKPTDAQMGNIVSNSITTQFLPVAVEKRVDLEKIHGPAVTGVFGRVTDSKWTPILKDSYPNIADGMFRCGSIWGNFNILTHDKDGPEFKAGLKVIESLTRKP